MFYAHIDWLWKSGQEIISAILIWNFRGPWFQFSSGVNTKLWWRVHCEEWSGRWTGRAGSACLCAGYGEWGFVLRDKTELQGFPATLRHWHRAQFKWKLELKCHLWSLFSVPKHRISWDWPVGSWGKKFLLCYDVCIEGLLKGKNDIVNLTFFIFVFYPQRYGELGSWLQPSSTFYRWRWI